MGNGSPSDGETAAVDRRPPINGQTEIRHVRITDFGRGRPPPGTSGELVVNDGEAVVVFNSPYHCRIVTRIAKLQKKGIPARWRECSRVCCGTRKTASREGRTQRRKARNQPRRIGDAKSLYSFWVGMRSDHDQGNYVTVLDRDGVPVGRRNCAFEKQSHPDDARREFLGNLFRHNGKSEQRAVYSLGVSPEGIELMPARSPAGAAAGRPDGTSQDTQPDCTILLSCAGQHGEAGGKSAGQFLDRVAMVLAEHTDALGSRKIAVRRALLTGPSRNPQARVLQLEREHGVRIVAWLDCAASPFCPNITVASSGGPSAAERCRYDCAVERSSDDMEYQVVRTRHFRLAQLHNAPERVAAFALGTACLAMGDYMRANIAFARSLPRPDEGSAKDADVYLCSGDAALFAGNHREAAAFYTSCLELDPNRVPALTNRGICHALMNRPADALDDISNAVALVPGAPMAPRRRGGRHVAVHEHGPAVRDFSTAIALAGRDPVMYLNRGICRYESGEYERAIADFSTAIGLRPANAAAFRCRGHCYGQIGEFAQAIADFDRAIGIEPRIYGGHIGRGIWHRGNGEADLAIADFEEAIEIDPGNPVAYGHLAICHHQRGEHDLAIDRGRQAVRLGPTHVRSHAILAAAYVGRGDYNAARREFDTAIRLDCSRAELHKQRITCHPHDHDAVIADLSMAISLDPDDAEAYALRGYYYARKEELEAAIADFTKVVELDSEVAAAYSRRPIERVQNYQGIGKFYWYPPSDVDVLDELGDCHATLGRKLHLLDRLAEARSAYDRAIELDVLNASLHYCLGGVLCDMEELEESCREFRRAIDLFPEELRAAPRLFLVFALLLSGKPGEAKSECETAMQTASRETVEPVVTFLQDELKRRPELEGGEDILAELSRVQ